MKEHPASMNVSAVRSSMEGRKTEMRQAVWWRPTSPADVSARRHPDEVQQDGRNPSAWVATWREPAGTSIVSTACPYGVPGDLLYVREPTQVLNMWADPDGAPGDRLAQVMYISDGRVTVVKHPARLRTVLPGHSMPNGASKEAARLWLRVEDVTVERLQGIDGYSARREGVQAPRCSCDVCGRSEVTICPADQTSYIEEFRSLWGKSNARRRSCWDVRWDVNPWVWAVRYAVASTTGRGGVK